MKTLVIAASMVAAMSITAHAGTWVKEPIYKHVKVCSPSGADTGSLLGGAILGAAIGNNIGDGNGNGLIGGVLGTIFANESAKSCYWERREHGYRWVHVD